MRDQIEIIEAYGYTAERFVWIHASAESNFEMNLELARRGAWIEYDWIGDPTTDAMFLDRIQRMLDVGLSDHLLISHDRGWYDPAQPSGGTPKPYTYISEHFLTKLRACGVDDTSINTLTVKNPFQAFAR